MPAQSPISNLMPANTKSASVSRTRSGGEDNGFRRMMESSRGTSPGSALEAPRRSRTERGAANPSKPESLREAHAESSQRPSRDERSRAEGQGGDARPRSSETEGRVPQKAASADPGSGNAARPEAAGKAEEAAKIDLQADAEGKVLEKAQTLLATLSGEDWAELTDDVRAVLEELKTQLDAGELDSSVEASLRDLLADLESGAPLETIVQHLQAMPLEQLPALAARFPEAKTLGDALGKRGAAHLAQLATVASRTPDASAAPSPFLTVGNNAGPAKSNLEALLQVSQESARTPRDEFGLLVKAMASDKAAKPVDLGTSATPPSSTVSLETPARAQPVAAADRQFTVQSDVRVPVGQAQWGQAVGQRVLWMASQKLSSAELRLDPPDLGPMQVRVSSHQDQISVTFTSAQPAVREALDQNATRLREMFAEQGLDLVDVNVSDQSGGETAGDGRENGQGSGRLARSGEDGESVEGQVVISERLVDHYA